MYLFTEEILNSFFSYKEYKNYFEQILNKKITNSPYNIDDYYSFTEANFKRQQKLSIKINLQKKLYNQLIKVAQNWTFLIITEPWCSDASFSIPSIEAIAMAGHFETKYILRDQHEKIIDAYLTNGGRSIPILIALDKNLNELFNWGPRPLPLQKIMQELLKNKVSFKEKTKLAYQWYYNDNGKTLQKEILHKLKNI